jgi:hypothetical protein
LEQDRGLRLSPAVELDGLAGIGGEFADGLVEDFLGDCLDDVIGEDDGGRAEAVSAHHVLPGGDGLDGRIGEVCLSDRLLQGGLRGQAVDADDDAPGVTPPWCCGPCQTAMRVKGRLTRAVSRAGQTV